MSTNIKLKRSAVEGKVPLASDLELGELAINTFDGKLYMKKDDGASVDIVDVSSGLTANEVLNLLTTVDGAGSGLDADLLDGQHGTYYLNYNNFTNTPTVGDALITISAGSGLTTGGNFSTNQASNETITIDHADTSSQPSVDNSGGTVIQDITLDGFGHVTAVGSKTLITSDIGEGTNLYFTTARANTAIDARVTKSFVDALNVDADTLDNLNSTQFLRSDTSDTLNGSLTVTADLSVNDLAISTESQSTSSLIQTQIASFTAATYSSGKFVIQATDNVSAEVHVTELLVVHDGTTASATEYAIIHTGANPLATYDVDIVSGNVRVLATAASTNSTTYKVTENLIIT